MAKKDKKPSVGNIIKDRLKALEIAVEKQGAAQGGSVKSLEGGKATEPAKKDPAPTPPKEPKVESAAEVKKQEDEAARLMRQRELMSAPEEPKADPEMQKAADDAQKLKNLMDAFGAAITGSKKKKEKAKQQKLDALGVRG